MIPNLGGWIHSFTVTDTQTHKGGYTIYKITSIVFPRSVPKALTVLSVWKRFHDVKTLRRELARRAKSIRLPVDQLLPVPTDCSFFKRFDASVISRRKEYILQLLDFVAQHPALYKCHAFAQFFSDAQQAAGVTPTASPLHQHHFIQPSVDGVGGDGGAIAEICDKLDLRYDPHDSGLPLLDPERDKLLAAKGTDSQNGVDTFTDLVKTVKEGSGADIEPDEETIEKNEALPALADTQTLSIDKAGRCNKDYSRFLTPMASIESDDSDYIYEAALEFSHAVQAEVNLEYREAHDRYKRGVEVLLHGSKDDSNDDRKFIAKAKIAKYLARVDDIYDRFLRDSGANSAAASLVNFQLAVDVSDVCSGESVGSSASALFIERPWNQLAKYKVVQVLGERVMQVQCITEPCRPAYVMKGVEKPSSSSPTQTVFLPQHVPYMVDLLAFFQSEQKLFLLLKQAEGGRLYDYVQTYTPTAQKATTLAQLFPSDEEQGADKRTDLSENSNAEEVASIPPSVSTDFTELVRCSQELLQSVSNTLKEVEKGKEEAPAEKPSPDAPKRLHSGKMPEACLKQWARELAVAIHCLHGKGIILCDLHMENLLLGSKGQLLISYFYQNESVTHADSIPYKTYSPLALAGHFVAPERPSLTFKSDWWSYGVVLYQLLLGLPFRSAHPGHIDLYGSVQYPDDVDDISEQARDLLDRLLQPYPEDRLDFAQLQNHDFFAATNWEEVRQNGLNSSNSKSNDHKLNNIQ